MGIRLRWVPPLSFLRLIPPSVHLFKGEIAQFVAAAFGLSLDVAKARAEARRSPAQRVLRVYLEKARQVDECEQKIAEFFFHPLMPGVIARLSGGPRCAQLAAFLFNLVEGAVDGRPIKADARGAFLNLQSAHERGQRCGDSIEDRSRFPFLIALVLF